MATAELDAELTYEQKNTAQTRTIEGLSELDETVFHCHVAMIRENDGSFSAIVLNFPGVGSCGNTEEEAMENVKEAIRGMIESYKASNDPIPWKDPISEDVPEDAKTKWILVNG